MKNDQMLQLAFSVYNNPGVYALLLGSGVSRAAKIPTGWEIVKDLISQIAAVLGENRPDDPESWFEKRFGEKPRYDALLKELGEKSIERNALLRRYFEPSAAERDQGIKVPTQAHRAIAWLIQRGYVRVVLTTNFDRLLETALDDVNVGPDIITSQAQLIEMRPLQHSPCTIIKLHGDYRDSSFKNTREELAEYSDELNHLLERVFGEYGLIVCGWSGEWDKALREAVERTTHRRYSTYWTVYDQLDDVSSRLTRHCNAQVITKTNADDFFETLKNRVSALEKSREDYPVSVEIAIQRTKQLIPTPSTYIDLEESFRTATEHSYEIFTSAEFLERRAEILQNNKDRAKLFEDIWELYNEAIEIPLNMAATIAWYGTSDNFPYFTETLERWAEVSAEFDPNEKFIIWRLFPTLALTYVVGMAAIGRENWGYLQQILQRPRIMSANRGRKLAITEVVGDDVILDGLLRNLNLARFSALLSNMLRLVFHKLIPSDQNYGRVFDTFDMILGLIYLDQHSKSDRSWAPGHSIIYDKRSWNSLAEFWESAAKQGKDWMLLQVGLFEGRPDRVQDALKHYVDFARQVQRGKGVFDTLPDYSQIYSDNRADAFIPGTLISPPDSHSLE